MTVGLVIVSHSAQLARGVAELAGQMAQGKAAIAAAGGAIDDSLGTSADKILAAIQSLDGPDGVLVLLDLGSALLSAEVALEMLDDEPRARTRLTYAPLVEGAVAAAVEASMSRSLVDVQRAAEKTGEAAQLRLLKPVGPAGDEAIPAAIPSSPTPPAALPASTSGALEVRLALTNPTGLHARPASLFVQAAAKFRATIGAQVEGRERQANAASIMEVLSLGARNGETLVLRATGDEAQAALSALSELVQANFYESPPAASPVPASPSITPGAPSVARRSSCVPPRSRAPAWFRKPGTA